MILLNTIKKGKFGDWGKPEKIINTLLSNVFFFKNKVLKVYKHEKAFYGDLTDPEYRKYFYKEDFFWNNVMSPEIYLKLGGVKIKSKNKILLSEIDDADDYYIEMTKIDDTQTITNKFDEDLISVSDLSEMIEKKIEKLRYLSTKRKNLIEKIKKNGWYKLNKTVLEDLRQWAYMSKKHIPKDSTDKIVDYLQEVTATHDYFTNEDNHRMLSISIDNNCDNLLFLSGKPNFIDVMPPKEEWKVADENFVVLRTAVDAYVLGNKELGDTVYQVYKKYQNEIPQTAALVHEIRAAFIQWAYRHLINQHERAEKYKKFVEKKFEILKSLS